ncbi:MAG: hypothetical protein NT159_07850 [Proteobacteria bacterium]|nr:hypothetical protein [Pseudomonadota bacterium]
MLSISACATGGAPLGAVWSAKPVFPREREIAVLAPFGVSDADAMAQNEAFYVLRDTEVSERLPAIRIPPLSFTEATASEVLRVVLENTDISLSLQQPRHGLRANYGSVTVFNLGGMLPDVVERMSREAGFYYKYRDKVLTIQADRQFLLTLPPALQDDVYGGIANNLSTFGAQAPTLDRDRNGRTLMFRANRSSMARIEPYVNYLRAPGSFQENARSIPQPQYREPAPVPLAKEITASDLARAASANAPSRPVVPTRRDVRASRDDLQDEAVLVW